MKVLHLNKDNKTTKHFFCLNQGKTKTVLQQSLLNYLLKWWTMLFRLLIFIINPVIPLTVYTISCNTNKTAPEAVDTENAIKNYKSTVDNIAHFKKKLAANATPFSQTKIAEAYIDQFVNKMTPAWYGTPWKFTGTTKVPKLGPIACGYFVTTTLQDMGVKIDRIKYAQCASQVTLNYVAQKKHVTILNQYSFAQFIAMMKQRKDFLGLIGLDNHIGYITKTKGELYFIHSSPVTNGVIKELAANSSILKQSKWRSVAFITDDELFLKNWLAN